MEENNLTARVIIKIEMRNLIRGCNLVYKQHRLIQVSMVATNLMTSSFSRSSVTLKWPWETQKKSSMYSMATYWRSHPRKLDRSFYKITLKMQTNSWSTRSSTRSMVNWLTWWLEDSAIFSTTSSSSTSSLTKEFISLGKYRANNSLKLAVMKKEPGLFKTFCVLRYKKKNTKL